MNIAIVDDQREAVRRLRELVMTYLRQRHFLEVNVDSFASGADLLSAWSGYDLIFLDIVMPGPDGLQTARALRESSYRGELVFTTVLRESVFEAFSVDAADYLVKPIDPGRLARAMDRVLPPDWSGRRIVAEQDGRSRILDLLGQEYCEVIGRKIYLHQADGTVSVVRGRLGRFAEQAGDGFFRCHRSYLVNLGAVAGYDTERIMLRSGTCIPLSRRREMHFRRALIEYLGGNANIGSSLD